MDMGTNTKQTVIVDSVLEGSRSRRWAVLAVASFLIFTAYVMQYQISALSFLIVPHYSLDAVSFSNLMFAPMVLAAVIGIPLGAAADRYGSKRVVGICILIALVGAFLRVVSSNYAMLLASMLLIGFAPASINANLMRLLGAWFGDKTSFALGVYYACSGLGAFAALVSSAFMGSTQLAFIGSAVLLTIACILWFLFIENAPAGYDIPLAEDMRMSIKVSAKCSAVWLVAAITGLSLAAKTAYLSFLPQVLEPSLNAAQANFMASLVSVGGIIGCILGPFMWSIFKQVKPPMVIVTLITAVLMALSVTVVSPNVILFFLIGVLASVMGPLVEAIPCYVPKLRGSVGSAGGIIGSVSLAATYFIPLAISSISGSNYVFIAVLMAACFAAAIPLIIALPGVKAEDYQSDH